MLAEWLEVEASETVTAADVSRVRADGKKKPRVAPRIIREARMARDPIFLGIRFTSILFSAN